MTENDESKKIYADHRRELLERQRANSSAYDRAVLALSSAGLGASISFVSKIVDHSIAKWACLLPLSWIVFCLAIVSTVASLMTSQGAISKALEYAGEYYLNERDEYLDKRSGYEVATMVLNMVSGIAFVTAVVLTLIYMISNS